MKKKIGIFNLKINNIFSIYEACVAAGFKAYIIDEKNKILNYDIIILPGIGSFKKAMKKLNSIYFKENIQNFLERKDKLLIGICLGMQLFFTSSEEFGKTSGLNLIEGKVKKIKKKLIVPHTGWNKIIKSKKDNFFFKKEYSQEMFYFTHSFVCVPNHKENVIGKTNYNGFEFCSVVRKNNILGMQFHPEKSAKNGINLIKNFKNFKI